MFHKANVLALFSSSSTKNNLPQAVQDSTVSMYADDTSLCYQSHDLTLLNEAINSHLRKLDTWLPGNMISLNVAKTTHSVLISTKQKHNILKSQNKDLVLKIRDNELEVVKKKQNSLVCKSTAPWIGKSKSRQSLARSRGQLVFYDMPSLFSRKKPCKVSTQVSWSPLSIPLLCLGPRCFN